MVGKSRQGATGPALSAGGSLNLSGNSGELAERMTRPPAPHVVTPRRPVALKSRGKSRGLTKTHKRRSRPPFDCIALLLQGGGALGAYQGGVYEALAYDDVHTLRHDEVLERPTKEPFVTFDLARGGG